MMKRISAMRLGLTALALSAGCSATSSDLQNAGNGGAGPGSGGAQGAGKVPCQVANVVSERCVLCHASPPRFTSPMSLMGLGDFHAALKSNPKQRVFQRALELVTTTDSKARMPPTGTVSFAAGELKVLTDWLDSGAPGDAAGCAIYDPEAPGAGGTAGGAGGSAGSSGGKAGGSGGSGGSSGGGSGTAGGGSGSAGVGGSGGVPKTGQYLDPYPGWDADPDLQCYKFVAHDGTKNAKYRVGSVTDGYFGFAFMPPWTGTRYVRAMRKITDNSTVLHHWLFFQQAGAVQDGAVSSQLGAHPDGTLMHGWAPGGGDIYFTPDVGLEMPSTRGYLLEIHYNSTNAAAVDASGLEICVTSKKPDNVTILSWLGTDAITGTSSSGTCNPKDQRIRILSGTPHMHLKGRHMKVVINRVGGTKETAHDEDFAFENQRVYPKDIWIEPGDTITTTCTWSAPSTFGKGTNQEMCYWFAMHYPALALADGLPVGTLIHGPNSCLGQ